ncbi:MAG: phage major tail protein, TP901-1 family [Hyphomonadaceae bacterium]
MAGQKGRDLLVRMSDGAEPETFAAVAGVQTRSVTLSTGVLDITAASSPGAWREVLPGAGAKRIDVSGSGVFRDAASGARMRAAFFAAERPRMALDIPGLGVLTGPFVIQTLSWSGEEDDEARFALRLMSAGQVSFEAES